MYTIPLILLIIGIVLFVLLIKSTQSDHIILSSILFVFTSFSIIGFLYGTSVNYVVTHTNYSIRLNRAYKSKKSLVKQRNRTKRGTHIYRIDTKPIKRVNQEIEADKILAKYNKYPHKYIWSTYMGNNLNKSNNNM